MNTSIFVKSAVNNGLVDSVKLANDVQIEINSLNEKGYKIISTTPITTSEYFEKNPTWKIFDKANFSVTFSYTSGIIIVAELLKGN
jgi:hypothetical protein